MIAGVGVDAVPVARMRRALERTPRLAERVFTAHEREIAARRGVPEQSFAARFAAKEAARKALGGTIPWRDVEVVTDRDRRPWMRVAGHDGYVFHLSLSHTDELAIAFVVVETR